MIMYSRFIKKIRFSAIVPGALILISGLLGYAQSAQAQVACSFPANNPGQTHVQTINIPASYAGNDLPVGSTIYRSSASLSQAVGVQCNGPFNLQSILSVISEPSGAPTTMTTAYGTGPVYPTNVPGVGVVVWSGTGNNGSGINRIFSASSPAAYSTFSVDSADGGNNLDGVGDSILDISLVKTGPISSGAVVDAGSFPTISWSIPATAGYSGLPLRLMTMSFAGGVHFITQTCTTPDVNVDLGKFDIGDTFKNIGSHTDWVDSSIVMQGCPTFSGYHGDHGAAQSATDNAVASGTQRNANILTVSLSPANPVSDGIIGLDRGEEAATGVGIQMGYSPDNLNAAATSPQAIWTTGKSWNVAAPTDGRTTIKIPLAARYIQNAERVTPGKADAKVTFYIYYK